jgi:hypothetical protein
MMQAIHSSARYTACLHATAGLIVQSTRKAGGVRMAPEHPQFASYVDGFKTAIDASEADALCRALLNS